MVDNMLTVKFAVNSFLRNKMFIMLSTCLTSPLPLDASTLPDSSIGDRHASVNADVMHQNYQNKTVRIRYIHVICNEIKTWLKKVKSCRHLLVLTVQIVIKHLKISLLQKVKNTTIAKRRENSFDATHPNLLFFISSIGFRLTLIKINIHYLKKFAAPTFERYRFINVTQYLIVNKTNILV